MIEGFEGCRLQAYKCPAGIWTIGYGHTGPDVFEGLVIDQAHADALLAHDSVRFAVAVSHICPVANQNQFDAMVSLCYNIGAGNFSGSSVARMHNAQRYGEADLDFALWNKIDHVVNDGLTRRRAAEAVVYRMAA